MCSFLFLCDDIRLLLRVRPFYIVIGRGKVCSLITLGGLMFKFNPLITLMLLLFFDEIFDLFSFFILPLKLSPFV